MMKLRTIKNSENVSVSSKSNFVKQAPQKVQYPTINTVKNTIGKTFVFHPDDLKKFDEFKAISGLNRTKLAIESIKRCIKKKNHVTMIRPTAGNRVQRVIHIPIEYDDYLINLADDNYESKSNMLSMLMLGFIKDYEV